MESYLSPIFNNDIWPMFSRSLNTAKSKADYYAVVRDISRYTKKDFLEIKESDAQGYFNHLLILTSNGKQSVKTVKVKLARLKSVSNFILRHSYLFELQLTYTKNPFLRITMPQTEDYLLKKNVPDIEELNHILAQAESDPQLYLILSMMIRCGISAGEICMLKFEDFVRDDSGAVGIEYCYRSVKRYIKLPDDVLEQIREYIGDSDVSHSAYLFHNRRGNQLRIRDLERLYLKYVPASEDPHFTLSDIRNGSAAYMLVCGAPADKVAEYIGIAPEWMRRFDRIIPELHSAAVDYSNIRIKVVKS